MTGYLGRLLGLLGEDYGQLFAPPYGPSREDLYPMVTNTNGPLDQLNYAVMKPLGTALDLASRGLTAIPLAVGAVGDAANHAMTGEDSRRFTEDMMALAQVAPWPWGASVEYR
jgi:hypothetical protein